MARKYTSKETKKLIECHKENIKHLEAASLLPTKYGKQIQNYVNYLLCNNIFTNVLMAELRGNDSEEIRIGELIRLLFLFKRATQQSIQCKYLLQNNKERIQDTIKEASAGSNAVSWLFSTSKKKLNSENAYDILAKDISGSYYWSSSQEVLSCISENDNISVDAGLNDFSSCKDEYKGILQRNLPNTNKLSEPVRELTELARKFDIISANLAKETNKTDLIKEAIKDAAERMTMSAVLDILKTVPVEEINRDKKGFRVKALRDAGYTTMADLYVASSYQLSTVYGISEDASYSIKSIAKDFAIEAKHNAKIKLSIDNKTNEATKLVSELFRYRQYSTALESLDKLETSYGHQIKAAIDNLKTVDNGVFWMFLNPDKKENIKRSYSYLIDTINGDYSTKANEIVMMFKKVGSISTENAWDDFKNNSILYYNILEKVVPGILGNDDQLYGLPEDLAREIQEECFFPDGLNCNLRRYQEWGVKYILHQERVLLGDEMGLGKTVQAIATMVSLRNTGASHFIVVCPASVLPNWCKEIPAKSKLRVTKVHGSGRTQAIKSWMKTGGVAVTTYETTGIFSFDEAFKFDLLIVDEAHFIKNTNASRSRNVRKLATFTKRMLFMTGTALENKVDEMISLIDVLQPDVAKNIQNIAFMSTAPQFREKIAGVYYRRKREDVLTELPDLIENREWCTMSEEENRLYEQEVLAKNFMGIRRLSWNVDDLSQSCKAQRMTEIIEEAEKEGRKVLIFSFFLDTIRKIHAYLGDRCCNTINGSLQPQRRQEIIDQFNDDPKKTVLCAQIQSGGTGLNIQTASVVIICEPQFKPSIENQAISRAYRMGQSRNVLVYRLLCEDTVDERITELLEEKQAIFDAFADKSVAAAKTVDAEKEMDDTTFSKIIEEEIERIKAKNGTFSYKSKDESLFKGAQPQKKATRENVTTDNSDFVPKSALTSSEEYAAELEMDYNQLVNHLLRKYGSAKGDFFCTETCASENKKIKRTSEGLFCHHIDEDKAINLSIHFHAIKNPFEYQKAERLVYCNILEHLILHIKIDEAPIKEKTSNVEYMVIGGGVGNITKQINDFYDGHDYKKQFMVIATSYIKDNFEDYIKVLNYIWKRLRKDSLRSITNNKNELASGWKGNIVQKVYERIQ